MHENNQGRMLIELQAVSSEYGVSLENPNIANITSRAAILELDTSVARVVHGNGMMRSGF